MSTGVPVLRALSAVGELLAAEGAEARVVIVGGAALILLGVIRRATNDVDVIAVARGDSGQLAPPEPFSLELERAVRTVARDLQLPPNWMNTVVSAQWQTGLPPAFTERVEWRRFANLWVGLPGREALIALKLYAAADQTGPDSRHMQDLIALRPSDAELAAAATWIQDTQDSTIAEILGKAVSHVRAQLR